MCVRERNAGVAAEGATPTPGSPLPRTVCTAVRRHQMRGLGAALHLAAAPASMRDARRRAALYQPPTHRLQLNTIPAWA
jgi:hypothetical protein